MTFNITTYAFTADTNNAFTADINNIVFVKFNVRWHFHLFLYAVTVAICVTFAEISKMVCLSVVTTGWEVTAPF